jgi:hypothetical protein
MSSKGPSFSYASVCLLHENPFPLMASEHDTKDLFLGHSNFGDYVSSKIVNARTLAGLQTFVDDFNVFATRDQWKKFIERFEEGHQVVQLSHGRGYVINWADHSYFRYEVHANSVEVHIHGDRKTLASIGGAVRSEFEEVLTHLEWVHSTDRSSVYIPLGRDRSPVDEMFPFLGEEKLTAYYERFMESLASVLLLIGPPGTGKTSFIRGLMQHTQSSAVVTYDEAILSHDDVFAQFVDGDQRMMIVEDADMFLRTRSGGNASMHKFLNIGDGLVTMRNKKLIFSTNLPSAREIDPALIRPGRCFDVVSFDYLNNEQASTLAQKLGIELGKPRERWSIADVFHPKAMVKDIEIARSRVGFG